MAPDPPLQPANASSGRFPSPFLLSIHVLGYLNWWYGPFRLWTPLANYLVMIPVFSLPVVILVRGFGIRRRLLRIGVGLVFFTWVLWCVVLVFGSAMALAMTAHRGADPAFEYLHSTPVGSSRVAVYLLNGGATTDYGIVFRHERKILVGLRLVKQLPGFYHCVDGEVHTTDALAVELSCSQPTGAAADVVALGRTQHQLKPYVIF